MNTLLFHARCVTVENNEFGYVLGFADHERQPQRYLQIQRSHADRPEDGESGMNTYYVEKDDQANSLYGGIEKVILREGSIDFTFNRSGCERLGLQTEARITFESDLAGFKALKDGLNAVFRGSDTVCFGFGE